MMKSKNKIIKIESSVQIFLLVISIIAFSVLIAPKISALDKGWEHKLQDKYGEDYEHRFFPYEYDSGGSSPIPGAVLPWDSGSPIEEGGVSSPIGVIALGQGMAVDYIVAGTLWAVTVYGIGQVLGNILGFEGGQVSAISTALSAGIFANYVAKGFGAESGLIGGQLGLGALGWGIVVGVVVFEIMWKSQSTELIVFECYPWQASDKGKDCEKCNSELYPCTEYRCKSLGQACSLLNEGSEQEMCAWVNPGDVKSPIIEPWKDVLTEDHNYQPDNTIRPPDRGVNIFHAKSGDGCVKAFAPLEFGIQVNEPAQCKIDYERKDNFDDMAYYFGNSNIYKYNHSQKLSLPGPDAINAEAPELEADGNYNLYVRCKDANGNANDDLFVFKFCVEKGPDVTPPKIEDTSITNDMPFQYGLNQTDLEVYVNEPAECKWSRVDQDYENMEHDMSCSRHVWEMTNQMLYKCLTTLTGLIDRQDNIFYFRCKDQPLALESDRNTNRESYKFVLKGTQPLNIVDVHPNETVIGYTAPIPIYLELETENGYNLGDSWCYYGIDKSERNSTQMFETGENKHKQRLDLAGGEYTYYFWCVDLGGNSDTAETTFRVEIDIEPPMVVRVYHEGGNLKILTDEKSSCSYQTNEERECSFEILEGTNMPYTNSTEHFADWIVGKTYYIKCQDQNGRQPLPNECSIIITAQD